MISRHPTTRLRARIPRLYAAASLKQDLAERIPWSDLAYSAALCRGLIEARVLWTPSHRGCARYSAALCRGLIEACGCALPSSVSRCCIPRLYAAASLKPQPRELVLGRTVRIPRLYAAASLKPRVEAQDTRGDRGIPRLYAAASLKHEVGGRLVVEHSVFRGFMPRPH